MKEEQLKKLGNLLEAINAVIEDHEIPIDRITIERNSGDKQTDTPKFTKPGKKEYSEEEIKARAEAHSKLSKAIETYRLAELRNNNKILVTITHLANALKRSKYDVVTHLKELVKENKIQYIVEEFSIGDDPTEKRSVKLVEFNELAAVEKTLPEDKALFNVDAIDSIASTLKNVIMSAEDMVAPM